MDRVRFIEHNGKQILIVDVSDSTGEKMSAAILASAREKIDAQPPKSLLLLTNVTNTHYDSGGGEAMKQYSKANTPFIKAAAAVGVTGVKRVLLSAVVKLIGRPIATFDSVEAGLDWLAKQ